MSVLPFQLYSTLMKTSCINLFEYSVFLLGKGHLPVPLVLDATSCTLDAGALASFTKGLLTSKSCPSGLTLILVRDSFVVTLKPWET